MDATAALLLDEAPVRGAAILFLSLATVGAIAWLIYRRAETIAPRTETMSFMGHLDELRTRILRAGAVVLLWSVLFLGVRIERFTLDGIRLGYPVPSLYENIASQVYLGIVASTVPSGVQIFVSTPMEAVAAQMEVSLILAFIVGFPFLLYEAWAFFSPGLKSREQRVLRSSLPWALLLFACGSVFGYVVVVPLLFQVLYGFAAPLGAVSFLSAGTLVSTVTTMTFLFGLAFELPLVMVALVRMRLLTPRAYLRKWRHATVGIFVVAAFASDPTLTSQLIIGTLLLALYWGGVLASFLVQPDPGPATTAVVSKA